MPEGTQTMPCKLSGFTTAALIEELIHNRDARFILIGPLKINEGEFFVPVPEDMAGDDKEVLRRLQEISDHLQEVMRVITKSASPSCLLCGWYGFDYQEGTCPVCGKSLSIPNRRV